MIPKVQVYLIPSKWLVGVSCFTNCYWDESLKILCIFPFPMLQIKISFHVSRSRRFCGTELVEISHFVLWISAMAALSGGIWRDNSTYGKYSPGGTAFFNDVFYARHFQWVLNAWGINAFDPLDDIPF